MATRPAFIRCTKCEQTVKRTDWPRDAAGHLKPRCAPCMFAYREPKPRKRPSPEQKAAYARENLGVPCEYIPQAIRNEIAIKRRAEKASADKAATLQRRQARAAARAEGKKTLHEAHVLLFRSDAIKWLVKYHRNNEFV